VPLYELQYFDQDDDVVLDELIHQRENTLAGGGVSGPCLSGGVKS